MKKIVFLLIGFSLLLSNNNLFSQTDFYTVYNVREVKIYFDQPNWDHLLDSMFTAGNGDRLVATKVTVDGTQLDSVGVRYKGYSSASINRIKNPFIKRKYILAHKIDN